MTGHLGHQPLTGVRVVEIDGLGPVPFACRLLAGLGADVLRITRPESGPLAGVGTALTVGRPAKTVDLKTDEGRRELFDLLHKADVLVEGLRPGAMERLGLGPREVQRRFPRIVYARMTGWGQDGPLAERAGHDITYAAIAGVLHLAGSPEQPLPPANLLADFGGGSLFLVVGILAALLERERTGSGQVVDAAMVDGAAALSTMLHGLAAQGMWSQRRGSNLLDGGAPFYSTYRCSDGGFVAVGALEPQFYAALVSGLDLTAQFAQDEVSQENIASWPAMRAAFTETFARRTRDEWAAHFEDTDACVAPVLTLRESTQHPHLTARGVFAEEGGAVLPRVAPRFSGPDSIELPRPEGG
ncbi:MAG: CaiB/BaiF CoA-transferase family protein [Actinomycetia bacterium]|nr:CaiB/BaiF CoA-transferase family protein [Actinomycetes bacterium]